MLMASLKYSHRQIEWKNMSEEKRAAMYQFWPGVKQVVDRYKNRHKDDEEKANDISSWEFTERNRITMEEAHGLEIAGIELELEGVDGTMLTKMQHREDKYGAITPMEMTTGQVVQIAVPDLGLLQINETTWLENSCTEVLQDHLDKGWRILAVCPPNAQRRPDYILGRHKVSEK